MEALAYIAIFGGIGALIIIAFGPPKPRWPKRKYEPDPLALHLGEDGQ